MVSNATSSGTAESSDDDEMSTTTLVRLILAGVCIFVLVAEGGSRHDRGGPFRHRRHRLQLRGLACLAANGQLDNGRAPRTDGRASRLAMAPHRSTPRRPAVCASQRRGSLTTA